jgi:hypothetical protein
MVGGRERSTGRCWGGGFCRGGAGAAELTPQLAAFLLPMFCCMRQWILNQLDRRPYLHNHQRSLSILQTHLSLFLQGRLNFSVIFCDNFFKIIHKLCIGSVSLPSTVTYNLLYFATFSNVLLK